MNSVNWSKLKPRRQEHDATSMQSDLTNTVLKEALSPTQQGFTRSPMLANIKTPQDAIKSSKELSGTI